eukprot:6137840-Prorocentrum_lima.AAC.1
MPSLKDEELLIVIQTSHAISADWEKATHETVQESIVKLKPRVEIKYQKCDLMIPQYSCAVEIQL